MNKPILTFLFVLFGFTPLFSQDIDPITIGTKHKIHSTILNEEREYWINLPESYDDEGTSYKKYPLLIILDGNLHFQSITGAVNYMSSGYNGNLRIPEMIVVAIQNINRRRDFTPDKIVTSRPNDSGGGENFLSFLEKELIPELDKNFRTTPYRILFGHSLGGLLATHAYMKEHTLFNSFIAVDPSFGTWDDETMDQKLEALTENSFDRYLYIATANWGKRNIRNRDRHVRLFESLNSKCEGEFPAKLEYFQDENHGSVPQIAFYNGISAIFEGYGIYYRDIESKDQLDENFKALSNRLSFDFYPTEQLVNRIGYTFLQSRNDVEKTKALDFFILNTEYYPNSYNAFDSLGEAYEMLGNLSKAIENYQKSLALNPDNKHAANRISNLKENM
ncbi:alpha/beta hydrolase-fold protein [Algoriphagus zhangzhouensis]|uniref:Uncharacterized protein n=1 Tax=Algoriphagus zhangzhouensis TaxID=1073327 RepID=A0A1M7ZCR0_9BACT|nr:alpha/beta hydrolase-fold protein [Algoriphagus zhangzhouensis]TDY45621.1 hypothetical protein A8938_2221 [Algoriphagus zhangzhouensis]SHO62650.1 hypothetical protein SAMN04488108_2219 [Algoriphagus zhangzhouensis]